MEVRCGRYAYREVGGRTAPGASSREQLRSSCRERAPEERSGVGSIPSQSTIPASIAKSDRAPGFEPGDSGFESSQAHQLFSGKDGGFQHGIISHRQRQFDTASRHSFLAGFVLPGKLWWSRECVSLHYPYHCDAPVIHGRESLNGEFNATRYHTITLIRPVGFPAGPQPDWRA